MQNSITVVRVFIDNGQTIPVLYQHTILLNLIVATDTNKKQYWLSGFVVNMQLRGVRRQDVAFLLTSLQSRVR